jgi:hypothetical protein
MDQDRQIYTMQPENFKKMLHKYGKSQILIARLHFSMVLIWRQLHTRTAVGIFRGLPIELARPDGVVTFTRLCKAIIRYYRLCALSTAESLGCPKSIGSILVDRGFHNISGSTIFRLFKSSWVPGWPGCTAAGRIL